jgi:hypothetical protein
MLNVTMKMKIVRMKLFESILSKHQDEELEGEESDEDDTSELERVTTQDARKFIDRLRRYFMQEGSPLSALDVCADIVHSQSIKKSRQGTMDKFFRQ